MADGRRMTGEIYAKRGVRLFSDKDANEKD